VLYLGILISELSFCHDLGYGTELVPLLAAQVDVPVCKFRPVPQSFVSVPLWLQVLSHFSFLHSSFTEAICLGLWLVLCVQVLVRGCGKPCRPWGKVMCVEEFDYAPMH
jgi:hypothetical protein